MHLGFSWECLVLQREPWDPRRIGDIPTARSTGHWYILYSVHSGDGAPVSNYSNPNPTSIELSRAPPNHGDRRPMQSAAARNDHQLLDALASAADSALFRAGQPPGANEGGSPRTITGCGVPSPFPGVCSHPASASAEPSDWLSRT